MWTHLGRIAACGDGKEVFPGLPFPLEYRRFLGPLNGSGIPYCSVFWVGFSYSSYAIAIGLCLAGCVETRLGLKLEFLGRNEFRPAAW